MQLSPAALRVKITVAHGEARRQLLFALFVRDVCLLAFAIAYIALFSQLFGAANTVVGVASFCMLLSFRFVNYGYRIQDSLIALAIVLSIITANSVLTFIAPIGIGLILHWLGLLIIVRLTAQRPEFGNGGVYAFSYVLVSGAPVAGQLLWLRVGACAFAWLLCGTVLWRHHRQADAEVRIWQILRPINLHLAVDRWQLRLVAGVALALTLGNLLGVMRPLWCGLAAMSALVPFDLPVHRRAITRLGGVVIGAGLFALLVKLLPPQWVFLLAPLAGFGLGLTGSYFVASILNCFGALSAAYVIYGVTAASGLRVLDNGIGLVVAVIIAWVARWLWRHHTCAECAEYCND